MVKVDTIPAFGSTLAGQIVRFKRPTSAKLDREFEYEIAGIGVLMRSKRTRIAATCYGV